MLPDINNVGKRQQKAKRQSVNSVVQGSAGDLVKVCMPLTAPAMQVSIARHR
jgi:DNA polymerase I-like protein with 3'-5' exonuclease and polymerase domains